MNARLAMPMQRRIPMTINNNVPQTSSIITSSGTNAPPAIATTKNPTHAIPECPPCLHHVRNFK